MGLDSSSADYQYLYLASLMSHGRAASRPFSIDHSCYLAQLWHFKMHLGLNGRLLTACSKPCIRYSEAPTTTASNHALYHDRQCLQGCYYVAVVAPAQVRSGLFTCLARDLPFFPRLSHSVYDLFFVQFGAHSVSRSVSQIYARAPAQP